MNISIGSFLIDQLSSLGVQRIYGVPGDYNLEFLDLLEKSREIPFIGNCNELNAAYAADGEARLSGVSAVLTTYGVGDLSALAGIAGAYAEGVPVISISGAPPLHAIRSRMPLHHTLVDGNYDNVLNCFREFTVAQARITPENAVDEIDRVLRACWREKRPVHLQLPSDICYTQIQVAELGLTLNDGVSDGQRLAEAVVNILARLSQARRPLLLVDSAADRHRLAPLLERLVERFRLPFATLSSGKAILPETRPYFAGIYNGAASTPGLHEWVANSDCIVGIGVRFTDGTTAHFSQSLDPNAFIDIQPFNLTVAGENFAGVLAKDLLAVLVEAPITCRSDFTAPAASVSMPEEGAAWGQGAFWRRIARFIAPGDVIIAENGTSLAGITPLNLPHGCDVVSQPIWGAIGYALPATLGAALATPDRRHLLFIGDGSFQVTAQALSTIIRNDLKPIVFLINNEGYTIERLILGETSQYNDIADWRYPDLPAVMAPSSPVRTFTAANMMELEAALAKADDREGLVFIEVKFERMDAPEGMPDAGKATRRFDYGRWAVNS